MMAKLHALLLMVLVCFAGEAFSYRFLEDFRLVKDRDPAKDAPFKTPFVPCELLPKAKINGFNIPGCTVLPCPVSPGKTYNLTIAFTPDVTIKDLTSNVTATVLRHNFPYHVPIPDACKDQGLKCPLAPNVMANFTTSLPLKKDYPHIIVIIEWKLVDTNSIEQVCVKFSVKIV